MLGGADTNKVLLGLGGLLLALLVVGGVWALVAGLQNAPSESMTAYAGVSRNKWKRIGVVISEDTGKAHILKAMAEDPRFGYYAYRVEVINEYHPALDTDKPLRDGQQVYLRGGGVPMIVKLDANVKREKFVHTLSTSAWTPIGSVVSADSGVQHQLQAKLVNPATGQYAYRLKVQNSYEPALEETHRLKDGERVRLRGGGIPYIVELDETMEGMAPAMNQYEWLQIGYLEGSKGQKYVLEGRLLGGARRGYRVKIGTQYYRLPDHHGLITGATVKPIGLNQRFVVFINAPIPGSLGRPAENFQ